MSSRFRRVSATAVWVAAVALYANAASAAATVHFNVPAQPLGRALFALASQANVNVMFDEPIVKGKRAALLQMEGTLDEALERMLADTGLSYRFLNETTVVVALRVEGDSNSAGGTASPHRTQAAAAATASVTEATSAADRTFQPSTGGGASQSDRDAPTGPVDSLDEVIVTGTYFRNVEPLSPLITISREDILRQGYTRIDQVFEQLPQNFKDGASVESNPTSGAGANATFNYSRGAGVNLRGFGANATLLLLNGQRMPMSNFGDSVDISLIPVSMIERVEILTDGASATYGADAVAGVVNIITRSAYSGAEFGARATSISDGKTPNFGGYGLGGFGWGSGNVIASYDYGRDKPLLARNREFSQTAGDPTNILPEQETASYFATLRQDIADNLKLSTNLRFAERDYALDSTNFSTFYHTATEGTSRQLGGSAQLDYQLSKWHAALAGHYGREKGHTGFVNTPFGAESSFVSDNLENRDSGFEVRLDGPLVMMPAGEMRAAFGAARRDERIREDYFLAAADPDTLTNARHSNSVFAEALVPILGKSSGIAPIEELTLDLAIRRDDYSDFGSSTNPKVALRWRMPEGLSFHAVYGKSFRTPTLYQNIPSVQNGAFVIDLADPESPSGTTRALEFRKNDPQLGPERARSINAGLTFQPERFAGLKVDLSYFDIKFTDKIEQVIRLGYFSSALIREDELGSLVTRNPTSDAIHTVLNEPGQIVLDLTDNGYMPDQIAALINVGYVNAAIVHPRGLDLGAQLKHDMQRGQLTLDASASYFLSYDSQLAPGASSFAAMDRVFLPTRFRGKFGLGWQGKRWAAYSRLNYANSYYNIGDTSCVDLRGCSVSSFTTVDAGLSYSPNDISGVLAGLRIGLDISNALDREPPYVFQGGPGGFDYDATNANALQRAVAVTMTKAF